MIVMNTVTIIIFDRCEALIESLVTFIWIGNMPVFNWENWIDIDI